MILDGDDLSAALFGVGDYELGVERFHRKRIDDSGVDVVFGAQLGGRVQRLVQRDAGADDEQLIVVGAAQHLGLADGELLVVVVEDGRIRSGGADEANAFGVGCQLDGPLGADRVARIENGAAGNGAKHGQIFERHLAGPVLADADAAVRADEVDVRLRNGAHADLVESAREERGERRDERNGAVAARRTDRHAHQILLGDEAFDVALREALLDLIREGRVLRVAVQTDDALVAGRHFGQRRAVRQPRRHLFAFLVGGRGAELDGGGWKRRRERRFGAGALQGCRIGIANQALQVANNGFGFVAQRLSVPIDQVFDFGKEFTLERFGHDGCGLAFGGRRFEERLAQLFDVVAVDDDRVEAEALDAFAIRVHVVLQQSRLRLAQTVDIEDGAQIVQIVVRGEIQRLPDRAFGALAVADDAVGSVRGFVVVLAHVRHAAGDGQPLAQGTGGHVHEIQSGRRVALQIAVHFTQLEQVAGREETGLGPRRVQYRSGVSFRQNQPVVRRISRIFQVVTHDVKKEHGHNLGDGRACCRVAGIRSVRRVNRVDPQLVSEIFQFLNDFRFGFVIFRHLDGGIFTTMATGKSTKEKINKRK